jgi:RNA polymerase sigma-70 factor (ECF subfamily)
MQVGAIEPRWDRRSFAQLYDEALPQVYRYLLRGAAGSVAVAEDLTQETFTAAVREINRGNGAVVSVPWLITVARHRLVDHYRRAEREERKLRLLASASTPEPSVELRTEGIDRAVATDALAGLPPAQRAAIALRYLDDLTVQDVADALGKSVHATESLLARARTAIAHRLQEDDDA